MSDHRPADPRPDAPHLSDIQPPTTGDSDVDRILSAFAAAVQPRQDVDPPAEREELAHHVEAATRAHRGLQDRLSAPRG